jgi:hypothetical protein
VSAEDITVLFLVGLPVVAAVCLGLLARDLIGGGGRSWPLWVLLLGASCVAWGYYFSETP